MNLSNLRPPKGQRHKKRRLGQGMGTGRGKFAGRGAKGAKSISGYSKMRGFEGGQMPLHRRLPKRGFVSPHGTEYAVVNVEELNGFEKGSTVSPELLFGVGILRAKRDIVKVLGDGELKVALTVQAHAFSKSAQEKIAAAGGKVEVIR